MLLGLLSSDVPRSKLLNGPDRRLGSAGISRFPPSLLVVKQSNKEKERKNRGERAMRRAGGDPPENLGPGRKKKRREARADSDLFPSEILFSSSSSFDPSLARERCLHNISRPIDEDDPI